jgi:hypothetical protein
MMNERIKLLAEEAVDAVQSRPNGTCEMAKYNQKFAELIIEECIRYFNEDYQRDFGTLWREDLSKSIKQHFGVEE